MNYHYSDKEKELAKELVNINKELFKINNKVSNPNEALFEYLKFIGLVKRKKLVYERPEMFDPSDGLLVEARKEFINEDKYSEIFEEAKQLIAEETLLDSFKGIELAIKRQNILNELGESLVKVEQ